MYSFVDHTHATAWSAPQYTQAHSNLQQYRQFYTEDGIPYYYNVATGHSIWAGALDWQPTYDETSGHWYYVNRVTGESQWAETSQQQPYSPLQAVAAELSYGGVNGNDVYEAGDQHRLRQPMPHRRGQAGLAEPTLPDDRIAFSRGAFTSLTETLSSPTHGRDDHSGPGALLSKRDRRKRAERAIMQSRRQLLQLSSSSNAASHYPNGIDGAAILSRNRSAAAQSDSEPAPRQRKPQLYEAMLATPPVSDDDTAEQLLDDDGDALFAGGALTHAPGGAGAEFEGDEQHSLDDDVDDSDADDSGIDELRAAGFDINTTSSQPAPPPARATAPISARAPLTTLAGRDIESDSDHVTEGSSSAAAAAANRFVGMTLQERTSWLKSSLSGVGASVASNAQVLALMLTSKSLPFVQTFMGAVISATKGAAVGAVGAIAKTAVSGTVGNGVAIEQADGKPSTTIGQPAGHAGGSGGGRFSGAMGRQDAVAYIRSISAAAAQQLSPVGELPVALKRVPEAESATNGMGSAVASSIAAGASGLRLGTVSDRDDDSSSAAYDTCGSGQPTPSTDITHLQQQQQQQQEKQQAVGGGGVLRSLLDCSFIARPGVAAAAGSAVESDGALEAGLDADSADAARHHAASTSSTAQPSLSDLLFSPAAVNQLLRPCSTHPSLLGLPGRRSVDDDGDDDCEASGSGSACRGDAGHDGARLSYRHHDANVQVAGRPKEESSGAAIRAFPLATASGVAVASGLSHSHAESGHGYDGDFSTRHAPAIGNHAVQQHFPQMYSASAASSSFTAAQASDLAPARAAQPAPQCPQNASSYQYSEQLLHEPDVLVGQLQTDTVDFEHLSSSAGHGYDNGYDAARNSTQHAHNDETTALYSESGISMPERPLTAAVTNAAAALQASFKSGFGFGFGFLSGYNTAPPAPAPVHVPARAKAYTQRGQLQVLPNSSSNELAAAGAHLGRPGMTDVSSHGGSGSARRRVRFAKEVEMYDAAVHSDSDAYVDDQPAPQHAAATENDVDQLQGVNDHHTEVADQYVGAMANAEVGSDCQHDEGESDGDADCQPDSYRDVGVDAACATVDGDVDDAALSTSDLRLEDLDLDCDVDGDAAGTAGDAVTVTAA